jgi:hypothetical protein
VACGSGWEGIAGGGECRIRGCDAHGHPIMEMWAIPIEILLDSLRGLDNHFENKSACNKHQSVFVSRVSGRSRPPTHCLTPSFLGEFSLQVQFQRILTLSQPPSL